MASVKSILFVNSPVFFFGRLFCAFKLSSLKFPPVHMDIWFNTLLLPTLYP